MGHGGDNNDEEATGCSLHSVMDLADSGHEEPLYLFFHFLLISSQVVKIPFHIVY